MTSLIKIENKKYFSDHFISRLKLRNITIEQVEQCLNYGKVEYSEKDHTVKKYNFRGIQVIENINTKQLVTAIRK